MKTEEQIIKGLEAELAYCMFKLSGQIPLQHWSIRRGEIELELETLREGTDEKSGDRSTGLT